MHSVVEAKQGLLLGTGGSRACYAPLQGLWRAFGPVERLR